MAKKQTIILTHGSNAPEGVLINKGEVLVQHAVKAKDAALWTVLEDGTEHVSFPSKAYVDAISETILAALDDRVNANADDIDAIENAYKAADEALQANIDTKVNTADYITKVGEIDDDIAALEGLLKGYEGEGSVKNDVESKVAQSDYDTKISAIEADIKANADAIADLVDTYVKDADLETTVNNINTNITKAKTTITEAASVTEGVKVVAQTQEDGHTNYTITAEGLATAASLKSATDRLDAIEGDDKGKSMREVAVEELANQLISDDAAESLNELKEIADWIQQHPKDASAMNTAIGENADAIEELEGTLDGFTSSKTVKDTTDSLSERIAKFEDDCENSVSQVLETAKGYTDTQVGIEKKDREDADKNINDKIGEGFSTTNTVAKAIADETSARTAAINGLQEQISGLDATYVKDTDLAAEIVTINTNIANAKTTITEGNPAFGVKVQTTTTNPNNYEISLVDVAKASDLTALDTAAVKTAEIIDATENKISASIEANKLTLNFNSMVIDGGEY